MSQSKVKSVFVSLLFLFTFIFFGGLGCTAWAEDVKSMLKQVNKELRQAQKDMFAGKKDKAIASLDKIQELLGKLKAADPNNNSIKTAENKFHKLVKDLERRTGKELGGGVATPAPTTTVQPSAAKKPGAAAVKLPYAARKPIANATRQLSGLDTLFNDLADPKYTGNKNQLVKRIEGRVIGAKQSLAEAKALAAKKGVTSHTDFDRVEAELVAAGKKIAQAKSGYKVIKAAASTKSEEVNADVKALQAECDRVSPLFEQATGTVIYYNDLKPVEKLIVRIEEFEKNELAKIKQKMEGFAKKYGSTRDEIDKKAESMGYSGRSRASFAYTELQKGIENVKKTRVVMAEDLVRKANEMLALKKRAHDFYVVKKYAKVKLWLKTAGRYDAENPMVKDALAGIDQRIDKDMKEFQAGIDKRTWPKHAANAPKHAKKFSKVALTWFKNSPDWGKRSDKPRRPLAVVVTGPWSIQKKNLLGEPIMYGLPVLLAVQVDRDKDLNVARVYSLTMRTVEKRGVKMEPPFDHITVGNSYFIRPNKVK